VVAEVANDVVLVDVLRVRYSDDHPEIKRLAWKLLN